jgi:hypothetical protein
MLQALFEKHNSFLRPLKKKGFKEKRVTTIGLYLTFRTPLEAIDVFSQSIFSTHSHTQQCYVVVT